MHMGPLIRKLWAVSLLAIFSRCCAEVLIAFLANKLIPPRSAVLPAHPYGLSPAGSPHSKVQ
jgi:hypothetical protein